MKTIVMSPLHLLSRILQAAGAVIQDAYSWSQTFAIGRCLRQAVVLSARITTSPFRFVGRIFRAVWGTKGVRFCLVRRLVVAPGLALVLLTSSVGIAVPVFGPIIWEGGKWLIMSDRAWKVAQAAGTIITLGQSFAYLANGIDASDSWKHCAQAYHDWDDERFDAFTKFTYTGVYGNRLVTEDYTKLHSVSSSIEKSSFSNIEAIDDDYAANVKYTSGSLLLIEIDEDDNWNTVLSQHFSSTNYISSTDVQALIDAFWEDDRGGLMIEILQSEKYEVSDFPANSRVFNREAGTILHQPTLDLAKAKNITYDAKLWVELNQLVWVPPANGVTGKWRRSHAPKLDTVDWLNIPAWKDHSDTIDGEVICPQDYVLVDYDAWVGYTIYKAVRGTDNSKMVECATRPVLAKNPDGTYELGEEEVVERNMTYIEYIINITGTSDLGRRPLGQRHWEWKLH